MNDFANLEKTIIRELSCRLCLCTDVVKLKPLSAEVKRKIKRLFDVIVRSDDTLPKAICHECLQQVNNMHHYAIKVFKMQKFLEFHKSKCVNEGREIHHSKDNKMRSVIALSKERLKESDNNQDIVPKPKLELLQVQNQGDTKMSTISKSTWKKKTFDTQSLEAMTPEEFAISEKVDRSLLTSSSLNKKSITEVEKKTSKDIKSHEVMTDFNNEPLDPIVLIDGKPAKQGAALDRQITLFYPMECCICHEKDMHFRSLMRHYKERHGVPGYVTCCDKKFHYFYSKKIIEHMAYHLQPNVFMCPSCHYNFQTSHDLAEHQNNGGRSEGKISCPRCSERYPTYHELGAHIVMHRSDTLQCDYCGKLLKHHHRKKTVNRMEAVILCTQCSRKLKNIEKQEKENKDKAKTKTADSLANKQRYQKFQQAMGLSADEEASTE